MVGASPRTLGLVGGFSWDRMFWDERGGGFTPEGPQVDTATIKTVLSTNLVDSESLAHDAVCSGVHTLAHILFGYLVSD